MLPIAASVKSILNEKSDLSKLSDEIVQCEVLITDSVKPTLDALLIKLQERLRKELETEYKCHQTFSHNLPIASVALNKDGNKCITGSFDNTCKLWNVEAGTLDYSINNHTGPVYAVAFNYPHGDIIITGSFDKSTCITSTVTGTCLRTLWGHSEEIVVVQYDANNNTTATASMDKTARLYNTETGADLWTIRAHEEPIVSLSFSCDGRNILTGSFDSNIYLWDVRTQRKVASFTEHTEEVSSCSFNFDSSLIVSGSVDRTGKIWDLRSDDSIYTIYHDDEVLDVCFDCTGKKFAIAGNDGFVKVFNASQGQEKPISILSGHTKEVSKVLFSPGGGLVLTGSADGTCRLWKTESGDCVQILPHKEEIFTCLFSYDGSVIVTGGNDSTCRIWKECETLLK